MRLLGRVTKTLTSEVELIDKKLRGLILLSKCPQSTVYSIADQSVIVWFRTLCAVISSYIRSFINIIHYIRGHCMKLVWNKIVAGDAILLSKIFFYFKNFVIAKMGDWPLCASRSDDITTVAHSWASCSQRKLKLMRSCGGAAKISSWHFGDFTS